MMARSVLNRPSREGSISEVPDWVATPSSLDSSVEQHSSRVSLTGVGAGDMAADVGGE